MRRAACCRPSVTVSSVAFWALDLHIAGAKWAVFLLALANALLGTSLGLFVSAFARTEFQALDRVTRAAYSSWLATDIAIVLVLSTLALGGGRLTLRRRRP